MGGRSGKEVEEREQERESERGRKGWKGRKERREPCRSVDLGSQLSVSSAKIFDKPTNLVTVESNSK